MSRALVEACAARIEQFAPGRLVYRGGVPDNPPRRYIVVRSSVGPAGSVDFANSYTVRSPTLWVTSVSMNDSDQSASDECMWGAEKAQDALVGWKPFGARSWRLNHESSLAPQRDEDLPQTTCFAVDTYYAKYHV